MVSVEIVGVWAIRATTARCRVRADAVLPVRAESQGGMSLVLRSTLPPATLTRMVRAAVSEMDKGLPVAEAVTMITTSPR